MATFWDGFIAGIIAAVVLRLGFVRIQVIEQSIAIWILLALAAVVTALRAKQHEAVLNPPLDGFILGFGWLFGALNLFGLR